VLISGKSETNSCEAPPASSVANVTLSIGRGYATTVCLLLETTHAHPSPGITLTGQIPRPILGRLELETKTTARCKHLTPMERNQDSSSLDPVDLESLEAQVDELIHTCDQLTDENRALRDQQSTLVAERASLIEKSELARSRVEAMIARLKAMEIGT
jgi:cell division protein ZapB